jgi:hypothetical protein
MLGVAFGTNWTSVMTMQSLESPAAGDRRSHSASAVVHCLSEDARVASGSSCNSASGRTRSPIWSVLIRAHRPSTAKFFSPEGLFRQPRTADMEGVRPMQRDSEVPSKVQSASRELMPHLGIYNILYSLLIGICVFLFSPSSCGADCTLEQRLTLAHAGYSSSDIDRLCSQPSTAAPSTSGQRPDQTVIPQYTVSPQNIPARMCVTNLGICQLATLAPIGIGCTCLFPNGVFYGMTR